jgi:hypothetical protein
MKHATITPDGVVITDDGVAELTPQQLEAERITARHASFIQSGLVPVASLYRATLLGLLLLTALTLNAEVPSGYKLVVIPTNVSLNTLIAQPPFEVSIWTNPTTVSASLLTNVAQGGVMGVASNGVSWLPAAPVGEWTYITSVTTPTNVLALALTGIPRYNRYRLKLAVGPCSNSSAFVLIHLNETTTENTYGGGSVVPENSGTWASGGSYAANKTNAILVQQQANYFAGSLPLNMNIEIANYANTHMTMHGEGQYSLGATAANTYLAWHGGVQSTNPLTAVRLYWSNTMNFVTNSTMSIYGGL